VTAALGCLLVLLALGLAERIARDRAWRGVPIRVHVNGSRGKSTVTRLIWSALREAGIPAVAKTTGTAARLLLPDGTERPVVRRAPPSIREQLALLRTAHRLGARAVVAECMALAPELQWASERSMLAATLGVITNVRLDHLEVMGSDLPTVAATLANSIPRRAVLVTGDDRFLSLFERTAAARGTRVVSSSAARHDIANASPAWLAEDQATALAATRQLGIPDEIALRAFASAPPDPGAARQGTLLVERRAVRWLDATAANDPESLAALVGEFGADAAPAGSCRVLVYNHRADRGPRLSCFAAHSSLLAGADRLVVTGARPPWTVWRALCRVRPPGSTSFVPARRLAARLRREPGASDLVFCGNTKGFDLVRLLEEVRSHG
jgi:poly-gamma-glutamate synthase PgsB/CapB